jgi:hypothetical protein
MPFFAEKFFFTWHAFCSGHASGKEKAQKDKTILLIPHGF